MMHKLAFCLFPVLLLGCTVTRSPEALLQQKELVAQSRHDLSTLRSEYRATAYENLNLKYSMALLEHDASFRRLYDQATAANDVEAAAQAMDAYHRGISRTRESLNRAALDYEMSLSKVDIGKASISALDSMVDGVEAAQIDGRQFLPDLKVLDALAPLLDQLEARYAPDTSVNRNQE